MHIRKTILRFGLVAMVLLSAVIAFTAPRMALAQDPGNIAVNWTGYYFNNVNFTMPYTLTRNDPLINFNWGAGSPDASIPADNFSVRWYTTINVPAAGTYTIRAGAEDGIRVAIDGAVVLDLFSDTPSFRSTTVNVSLGTGNHQVIVDYYNRSGLAGVQTFIFPASATSGTTVSGATLTPAPTTPPVLPPPPPPTKVSVLVIPSVAIVRASDDNGSPAVAEVTRGQRLTAIGKDSLDSYQSWLLVDLGGQQGWIYRPYVYIVGGDSSGVPLSSSSFTAPAGFNDITAITKRDTTVYDGPSRRSANKIAVLPGGQYFKVLKLSTNRAWFYIDANGLNGWVFILDTKLVSGSFSRIPVGN